jgi:hypothetical protein
MNEKINRGIKVYLEENKRISTGCSGCAEIRWTVSSKDHTYESKTGGSISFFGLWRADIFWSFGSPVKNTLSLDIEGKYSTLWKGYAQLFWIPASSAGDSERTPIFAEQDFQGCTIFMSGFDSQKLVNDFDGCSITTCGNRQEIDPNVSHPRPLDSADRWSANWQRKHEMSSITWIIHASWYGCDISRGSISEIFNSLRFTISNLRTREHWANWARHTKPVSW